MDELTYSIKLVEGRYEYRVTGGGYDFHQDYDPDCEGLVPMTEARAIEAASAVIASLTPQE